MKQDYDVLIVGCGPCGATLANLLRIQGHSVAIFDRDTDVFVAPRAMAIDPESCRIFQTAGVQARLEEADARPFVTHYFVDDDRKELLKVNFGEVEGVYGYEAAGMRFHQPSLERFLRDDFAVGTGVDAYLGYDVISVDGKGDKASLIATNTETGDDITFTGQFLIGADGGGSLCRKYIGSERIDFDYSRKWIVIDVIVHDQAVWDGIQDMSEFRCRPDAAVVYVKGFHNHVRFDFEVTEEEAAGFTPDDAIALMSEYIDTSSVEFQRMVPYHFYAGMPAEWRKGRVLIAGDAAHLTSPFSGQGLNMGIRDAANLAFKLDMVLSGFVDDGFLDTYKDERWKNCEYVIKGATQRGLMISAGDPWGKFKRWFGFWIGRNAPKIGLAAMSKSSIGFPYKDGLIGHHDAAGYQMVQPLVKIPDGGETLLDEAMGYGFCLLTMGAPVAGDDVDWFENVLGGRVLHIGRDVEDHTGKLAEYFQRHGVQAVMVRPDRYIFEAGDADMRLCSKLRQALGVYAPMIDRAAAA